MKRELEIIDLLNKENINIMFLTETDQPKNVPMDLKIKGYKTLLLKTKMPEDKVRIVALVNEKVNEQITHLCYSIVTCK